MTDPSQERPAQAKVSPDGKWVWDGHNWVPNPHPAPPQRIPEYPAPFTPAEADHPEQPEQAESAPHPPTPGAPKTIAPTPPWTPPKRSHALRNIVLSCAVLSILAVAGCTVFLAVAVREVGDKVEKAAGSAGTQGEEATVEPGKAFTLDGLRYQAGWRFAEDEVGLLQVKRLRFANTRADQATVVLRLDVLRDGDVVATVHCTSGQVPPRKVGGLTCMGADPRPEQYDEVRVTDLF